MVAIGRVSRTAPLRWTRRQADSARRRPAGPEQAFPEIVAGLPAVVEAHDDREPAIGRRPAAPFVAQLLANRFNLPQARRRMAASAGEAEASYLATDLDQRPTGPGQLVRRDI